MAVRAALAQGPGQALILDEVELDAPRQQEVRVRVEACGICHTDLVARDQLWPVPLPAVLGHEGVGVIEALGPGVENFAVGDRVLMSFGACGQCSYCGSGEPGYCQHAPVFQVLGQRLDGSSPMRYRSERITGHFFAQSAFSSHTIASTVNMVGLDDDLPPHLMAPLACGVQTGVGAVLESLKAEPGTSIAILGCGAVGLSAVMAARIAGCDRIVAVDLRRDRLHLARELGATDCIDGADGNLKKTLRSFGGVGAVVDTTGHPQVMRQGFDGLKPRGTLLCVGIGAPGAELPLDLSTLLMSGKSVRGCIEGDAVPRTFVPRMIEYFRAGQLPLEKLVRSYPFADINRAIADVESGAVVKAVLVMPPS